MRPVRTFTFFGKRWAHRLVARLGKQGKGDDGDIAEPTDAEKAIRVRMGLSEFDEMETYIHEFIHACCWWLDEGFVTQMAHEIARALWRLGFRRVKD